MMKVSIGKLFCLLILILIVVLVGVLGIHYAYNCEPPLITTKWGANDVLLFYGSVLTFIGTLSLGILSLYQNSVFKKESDKNKERLEKISLEANELNSLNMITNIEDRRVCEITDNIDKFTELADVNALIEVINQRYNEIIMEKKRSPTNSNSTFAKHLYIQAKIYCFKYYEQVDNLFLKIIRNLEQDKITNRALYDNFYNSLIEKNTTVIRCLNHYINQFEQQDTIMPFTLSDADYRNINNPYKGFKQHYLIERNKILNNILFKKLSLNELKTLSSTNQDQKET